ncbi:MAG: hypothetical protein AAFR21_05280 [Pseudomonadota bacterium]
MTFNEKMAWVMVGALLSASAVFFFILLNVSTSLETVPMPVVLIGLVIFVAIIVIIATVGATIAALSNVEDANSAKDERDIIFALKASHAGSVVTGLSLLATCSIYFMGARASDMLLGIIAALILGQLAEYMAQIFYYRRNN